MDLVVKTALAAGAAGAFPCSHWAHGGKGIVELAQAVADACAKPNEFKFLYPLEWSLKEKIEAIGLLCCGTPSFAMCLTHRVTNLVTKMYGGDGVEYSEEAEKKIETYTR